MMELKDKLIVMQKNSLDAGIGQVKLPLATLVIPSQNRFESWFLLSAKVPGKAAEDGPRACVPVTHVGDQDGVPGSWLLAVMAIYRGQVKEQKISLSLTVSGCLHKGWWDGALRRTLALSPRFSLFQINFNFILNVIIGLI